MIYSAYSSLDFRLAPVLAYGMHLISPAVLDGADWYISAYIDTQKKRRPRVAYSLNEAFALPKESNKQQETYADMTIHYTRTSVAV